MCCTPGLVSHKLERLSLLLFALRKIAFLKEILKIFQLVFKGLIFFCDEWVSAIAQMPSAKLMKQTHIL